MPGPVTDARAYELRERYHAAFGGAELPVPVEAIAEDLEGLRIEQGHEDGLSGMLVPDRRLIWLNGDDVPERRRFTIAHELGHWICQYREGTLKLFYCRPGDVAAAADRAAEREANVFVAELLMPEPAVRAAWNREPTLAAVADLFRVSDEAMHYRLHNLGLVEDMPRKA